MKFTNAAPRIITREQFDLVRPLLEGARKQTRPRIHDLYDVLCAILYREQNKTAWRNLPAFGPPWRTIHEYHCQWTMLPQERGKPVAGGKPLLARAMEILGLPADGGAK